MTDNDLEEIGCAEVQHRLDRGDYCDHAELKTVTKWLKAKDKEREFRATCERASISSALVANRAARRANIIAFLALVISAVNAQDQILAFIGSILQFLSH
ncbi:MAG: hypothetical protein H6992_15160 [Pseudomonadales bacterium]|nr:hypothetical protein [Pseudomonadales bacterium]